MKKTIIITVLGGLMFLVCATSSTFGSWLIYSKPEFRGRIIDAETKQPIEGVVVVAIYQTHTIISGPGGGHSSIIHVKEALTDKTGEFQIPAYSTVIQPNSREYWTDFIIYKPGYMSYTRLYHDRIYPFKYRGPEILFSKELGSKEEIRRGSEVVTITNGLVELPPLSTREERRRAMPGYPSELSSKHSPNFFETMNDERKHLGLSGEIK